MNQSISTIQAFKDCPLKYRLHTIIGLRRIEDESADHHLRFGSAWHAAMEVIYNAQRAIQDLFAVTGPVALEGLKRATLEKAKAAFLAAYPRQLDESDNAKTQESGCAAIESYYDTYAEEDRRRWKVLAVEAPETYDNGYIVHLDLVMQDLDNGGIYGFDHKTTKKALNGQGAYQFWGKFEPNAQITRYVDYIRSRYGSCEGFYIRATGFTYSSKKTHLGPAGFRIAHEQQLFNVNDAQIKTERGSADYWAGMIYQAISADKHDPNYQWGTNTDHCPFCQFKPICRSGWRWPEDRDLILNAYRVACREMTANLRPCELEPGHSGPHSEERPKIEEDFSIEVE